MKSQFWKDGVPTSLVTRGKDGFNERLVDEVFATAWRYQYHLASAEEQLRMIGSNMVGA